MMTRWVAKRHTPQQVVDVDIYLAEQQIYPLQPQDSLRFEEEMASVDCVRELADSRDQAWQRAA